VHARPPEVVSSDPKLQMMRWDDVFVGTCDGVVIDEPRGSSGFGYDPVFYLPGEGMTFGELPPARKSEISHRGRAVRAAADALLKGRRG